MENPTNPPSATPIKPPSNCVLLGENSAISALTFEDKNGKLELGAIFHIPTRQEAGKTYYKAVACKIEITHEQHDAIMKMLGGMPDV